MRKEDNMQLKWVLCNCTSLSGMADDLRTMLVPGYALEMPWMPGALALVPRCLTLGGGRPWRARAGGIELRTV